MGENCSAISRLIVHEDVKDALLERIALHLKQWPVGDPLDPANRQGALVSAAHTAKVCRYLEQVETALVGRTSDGRFVTPTVVETSRDNPLAKDEIFGPVLAVIPVCSFDQAIEVANDTRYGLCASIFTAHAKRAARMLRAGTVTVNSFGKEIYQPPSAT